MALQTCSECGNKISTESAACTKCGARIEVALPKTGSARGGQVWLVVLLALGLIVFYNVFNKAPPTAPDALAVVSTTGDVTHAAENYTLPPADTKTLIREIAATRNSDGTVTVSGTALLPPSTKIWVQRYSAAGKLEAQSQTAVGDAGRFSSSPFSDNGKPLNAGTQKVVVISYFNAGWAQPPSVLAIVGADGTKLPRNAVKLNDPEFPQLGGHIQEVRTIQFPPIGEDVSAVQHVKDAKLFVQGNGQATDSVEFIVGWMQKAGGFNPIKWSAAKAGSKWVVTLDCIDGEIRKQAQWEYDPASKKVRYLDPLSKTLSWLPAN